MTVGPDDGIVVLHGDNPHRAGTAAHRRHARLTPTTRVRDYVEGAIPASEALHELAHAHRAGAIGFAPAEEENTR